MLSNSTPSPLVDWELTLCLKTPRYLSSVHEDVRSDAEKDNKWLPMGTKMSQDNLALDLQHPKLSRVIEVLKS